MTPLNQQLEDKKREYKELYNSNHENFPNSNICRTCAKMNRCQAEITILEQAIAEMQKQRQEILDKIEETYKDFLTSQTDKDTISVQNVRVFKNRIEQQLNQPKTDK